MKNRLSLQFNLKIGSEIILKSVYFYFNLLRLWLKQQSTLVIVTVFFSILHSSEQLKTVNFSGLWHYIAVQSQISRAQSSSLCLRPICRSHRAPDPGSCARFCGISYPAPGSWAPRLSSAMKKRPFSHSLDPILQSLDETHLE